MTNDHHGGFVSSFGLWSLIGHRGTRLRVVVIRHSDPSRAVFPMFLRPQFLTPDRATRCAETLAADGEPWEFWGAARDTNPICQRALGAIHRTLGRRKCRSLQLTEALRARAPWRAARRFPFAKKHRKTSEIFLKSEDFT